MPDDVSTRSGGGDGEAVPTVSAGEDGNLGEKNELWEDDDEEEVDEINHAKLPRETIRAHSPGRRAHTSEAWTYLRRIHKHDVPGHEMHADCTHVCVCPLSDGEESVELTHGGSRKKCRRPDSRQTMILGVSSGVNTAETCGFSDDDAEEVVSEEEGGVEENLAEAKLGRAAELRTEGEAAFSEYRKYNRIELCAKGGWAQYLPGELAGGLPAPVIPPGPAAVDVSAEQGALPTRSSFFTPRGVGGEEGGVSTEPPTVVVSMNEPAPVQYDVMADLLHANMFKAYSDILRSESLRLKKGLSAKFGYLPMMAVATLGALNAESFCERVLSCVKLVVSDLHVRLKAEEIHMLVMLRMNREFMEYMRSTFPDTPLSEFKAADTYVRARGGLETLDDDEEDE
jgi:hypothetical protein